MRRLLRKVKQFLLEFRVLQVSTTVFLCYTLERVLSWMMVVPYAQLQEWQLAVFVATVPALVTGLFATLQSAIKPRVKEEEEG